ncbi:MAG: type I-B CRISPR-associated protein Cas8b/Csh1 [Candidatus Bathyarchaeia archaeon]
MFDALREIGKALLSSGEFEFPVERIKGRGTLLAKVIFDMDSGKLECDCNFKCDVERAKEFLWIGNAVGQKPQIVLTTDNPKYLLGPSKRGKWAIGRIISEICEKGFDDEDIRKLKCILSEVKEKFFSDEKSAQDFEVVLTQKGYRLRDIALFTTCVKKDEKIIDLVKETGYRKFLRYTLYAAESREYPILFGRCHICGEEKKVLTNPSYPEGTPLCIYNVDKAGFMPRLSRKPEDLLKAHAVCPDCKEKLVLGLNLVERKLTATIGKESPVKLKVFLIPKVVGTEMSYELLRDIASKMRSAFDAVRAYESLEAIESLMEVFMGDGGPYSSSSTYFLNLLFGYRVSSHFSFQYLIQDVPVTRLLELARLSSKISREAASLFNEEVQQWSIGFEDIFSIFPLKIAQNMIDWKPLVELFNSILTSTIYPKENIISRAVLFARINRYGTYEGYNIKPPKKAREELLLLRGLFKYNLLLKLLREIGVVEMERESEAKSFKIPDGGIEAFFSTMRYVEWQKALFLLGVLVGKIGIEQYKKGDEKKAVLNKINFEGMSAERVKLLANHVLEGLRNYRALGDHNETIYACMKMVMDRNLEALRNPIDNVFYILSGYAYVTLQAIMSGGEK